MPDVPLCAWWPPTDAALSLVVALAFFLVGAALGWWVSRRLDTLG